MGWYLLVTALAFLILPFEEYVCHGLSILDTPEYNLIKNEFKGRLEKIQKPESFSEKVDPFCDCILDPAQSSTCDECQRAFTKELCYFKRQCIWRDTTYQNMLADHSSEFNQPHIINVTENIYVAIGFGLANSILVVGPEGGIVIDTMESYQAAVPVAVRFRKILGSRPIVAIIYTHSHSDHLGGTSAFVEHGKSDKPVQIIGHESVLRNSLDDFMLSGALLPRSQRQFGSYLNVGSNGRINSGIGPALVFSNSTISGYLFPDTTFSHDTVLKIAGLEVWLWNTPGETSDHAFVYFPELKAACYGDNLYKTFPNLYSIRGTRSRSLRSWFTSIDRIKDLDVEYGLLSHTEPVIGKENLKRTLTIYRDAIQYIHDTALRWLNMGIDQEDIVAQLTLPKYLSEERYLQQFYGSVEWATRAVLDYYLGWFDGRAAHLRPLPKRINAYQIIKLANGIPNALENAYDAIKENRRETIQWGVQLAEAVLTVDPKNSEAKTLVSRGLRFLGYQETSANGRNYFISEAQRYEGIAEPPQNPKQLLVQLLILPVSYILNTMPIFLNTFLSKDVASLKVAFIVHDDDSDSFFNFHIRREVCELQEYSSEKLLPSDTDLKVFTDSFSLKKVLINKSALENLILEGKFTFDPAISEGSLQTFVFFLDLFRSLSVKVNKHQKMLEDLLKEIAM